MKKKKKEKLKSNIKFTVHTFQDERVHFLDNEIDKYKTEINQQILISAKKNFYGRQCSVNVSQQHGSTHDTIKQNKYTEDFNQQILHIKVFNFMEFISKASAAFHYQYFEK